MGKTVLFSIHPEHCLKIARGEKTVEVRKTAPKIPTPFKSYIYVTRKRPYLVWGDVFRGDWNTEFTDLRGYGIEEAKRHWDVFNGNVMGEFICRRVVPFTVGSLGSDDIMKAACLSYEELIYYFYGKDGPDGKTVKRGYGIDISSVTIYDTPLPLTDLHQDCSSCGYVGARNGNCDFIIRRPPQSWCYVGCRP